MSLTLSGITVYPIKSAGGIALQEWEVDRFGLRYDRRWMVVDQTGEFLSQRSHPRLALVTPTIVDGMLRLAWRRWRPRSLRHPRWPPGC